MSKTDPLPKGPFDIILADPPWSYYGSGTKDAAAAKHYDLLGLDDLAAMDVKGSLAKSAAVFMWATCPRLPDAIDLLRAWGLNYRGIAYIWVKTNKQGKIIAGQGVPPTFTKPTTELLLAATTLPRGRPFKILNFAQSQVVLAPRAKHSQKPEVFRDRIIELCGDRPRLELFSRKNAPGWTAWGNQTGLLDEDPNLFD